MLTCRLTCSHYQTQLSQDLLLVLSIKLCQLLLMDSDHQFHLQFIHDLSVLFLQLHLAGVMPPVKLNQGRLLALLLLQDLRDGGVRHLKL